jgi:DNA-binding GntR family transcriptional regulator
LRNRVIQTSASDKPLGRISLRSAPQTAAEALRNAIIGGQLRPGDRLIEQKLARSLGIGQPTLREALLELEYQGFVRKVPQRGTYVTKLTKDDFGKILEVRMALELLAIDSAVRNMTRDDTDILKALVEDMATAAKTFDLGAFHKSDMAFHRKVWALAGNEYLEEALEGTAFRLFAFVLLQRTSGSRTEFLDATEQHKAILAGLCSSDPAKARQAFVSNTLKFWAEHHQVSVGQWAFSTTSSSGLATSE